MFFSKPKGYLGIDLGAGGVKVVEMRLENKRPVLFTYGLTSHAQDVHHLLNAPITDTRLDIAQVGVGTDKTIPKTALAYSAEQVDKYAGVLKAVCKSARTVSRTAVVSLPVSAVFHAVINLPILNKADFDSVLKAEVKKLLPMPLEEAVLDYQVMEVGDEKKTQRVFVNAVPRALVVFYTQVFRKAGLTLEALEPESTALARALIGRDKSVNMLVDIGAERTNFFIVDQGVVVTHSSIEVGGNKINRLLGNIWQEKEEIIEQMKYDVFAAVATGAAGDNLSSKKILEILAPLVDQITKEIGYGFELYLHQSGNEIKRPEKIILSGGGALLPGLDQHLSNTFQTKCYIGDPWGRVVYQDGLKPALFKIGPRMAVAIGLSLRNVI